ncbi:hypothetical protein HPG69_004502 [Diceros bicornis minor]|uniref:non-specific serine/threonine protein kinase n=1 Tax=Diceros bicornis minor TaxID=77932 RepID=A0A7J7F9E6_DICBM|nr:hypothetical protein HPG69_004502 [Diceros bicornis minor]
MFDYLVYHSPMTEEEAQGKFRQLVSAVHLCHQRGIVHRDLSLESLHLDAELSVKLTDFGLSSQFIGHKLSMYSGSPCNIAPEILQGQDSNGPR